MQLQYTLNPYSSSIDKLMSFASLPRGWYFGRGDAIPAAVVKDASAILRDGHAYGFTASDVFPGAEGEVLVTFYENPNHYVQVSIDSPVSFEVVYEVEAEEKLSHECVSVLEVAQLLSEIYGEIWRTHSALPSTSHVTSTEPSVDSWTSHLNHLQMEVESPYLMRAAQFKRAGQFATICNSSTHPLQELQEHTGDSTQTHFPMAQSSQKKRARPEILVTGISKN